MVMNWLVSAGIKTAPNAPQSWPRRGEKGLGEHFKHQDERRSSTDLQWHPPYTLYIHSSPPRPVKVQLVKQNTLPRRYFPGPGDAGWGWWGFWQSGVHILCFIRLKWSDTSCSPPNFFACHSSLPLWIKRRACTTCQLCHSNAGGLEEEKKKGKKKRLHVTAQVELGRDSSVSFDFSV